MMSRSHIVLNKQTRKSARTQKRRHVRLLNRRVTYRLHSNRKSKRFVRQQNTIDKFWIFKYQINTVCATRNACLTVFSYRRCRRVNIFRILSLRVLNDLLRFVVAYMVWF